MRSCGRSFSASFSSSRSARGPARAPLTRIRASASTDRMDRGSCSGALFGLGASEMRSMWSPSARRTSRGGSSASRERARPTAHRRLHVGAGKRHHTLRLRCTDEKRGVGVGRGISWACRASASDVCARRRVGDRRVCPHRQRILRRLEDSSIRGPESEGRSRTAPLRRDCRRRVNLLDAPRTTDRVGPG